MKNEVTDREIAQAIFDMLARGETISRQGVANAVGMSKSGVQHRINKLIEDGYLVRNPTRGIVLTGNMPPTFDDIKDDLKTPERWEPHLPD